MTNVPYINLEYFFNKIFEYSKEIINKSSEILRWLSGANYRLISIIVSIVFALAVIFVLYKIFQLRKKEIKSLARFLVVEELSVDRTIRWKEIKKRLDSENHSDWKMAIISADSLMNEILENTGYEGKTLGERLKVIEPSDFDNLKNVWEAHKVRNKIVHEWEEFALSKEEAKNTLEKYEKALKELRYL